MVDGDSDVLFASEVSFDGLNGGVSEQELDLFEVSAEFRAELGTCPSQVWAPKRSMPICLADAVTTAQSLRLQPTFPPLPNGAQQKAVFDACRGLPGVDAVFNPYGNGHGANPAALAEEIDDHPSVLPHLDVLARQRCQLLSAQRTADQKGEQGVVALAGNGKRSNTAGLVPMLKPCLLCGGEEAKASERQAIRGYSVGLATMFVQPSQEYVQQIEEEIDGFSSS